MENVRINVYSTLFYAYTGAKLLYEQGIIEKDVVDLYAKLDALGLNMKPSKWVNLDNALNAILD